MNDIERELEFELHRVLDPISSVAIPPRRAVAHGNYVQRLVGGAGGALAIKVLTGVAVAAAAATVATAAATGTANPLQWSQGISDKVQTCKTDLAAQNGGNGIGQCVSDIAQHHGASGTNDESHHGNAGGNGNGNGNGSATSPGQGHGQGKDNGKSKDQVQPPKGK